LKVGFYVSNVVGQHTAALFYLAPKVKNIERKAFAKVMQDVHDWLPVEFHYRIRPLGGLLVSLNPAYGFNRRFL
jgi:hypothetical protein